MFKVNNKKHLNDGIISISNFLTVHLIFSPELILSELFGKLGFLKDLVLNFELLKLSFELVFFKWIK